MPDEQIMYPTMFLHWSSKQAGYDVYAVRPQWGDAADDYFTLLQWWGNSPLSTPSGGDGEWRPVPVDVYSPRDNT